MICKRCLLETSADHRELDCISALRTALGKTRGMLEAAKDTLRELKNPIIFYDTSNGSLARGVEAPQAKLNISPQSGEFRFESDGRIDYWPVSGYVK